MYFFDPLKNHTSICISLLLRPLHRCCSLPLAEAILLVWAYILNLGLDDGISRVEFVLRNWICHLSRSGIDVSDIVFVVVLKGGFKINIILPGDRWDSFGITRRRVAVGRSFPVRVIVRPNWRMEEPVPRWSLSYQRRFIDFFIFQLLSNYYYD
jgi:hypothetical protein